MEKYPENMMRAMGYFEFFYMDQLDKKKKSIERFKEKYPDVGWYLVKEMKGLYSLNQARKSMREAMALTLDDDTEVALERYMLMHNFLAQGEKKIEKFLEAHRPKVAPNKDQQDNARHLQTRRPSHGLKM